MPKKAETQEQPAKDPPKPTVREMLDARMFVLQEHDATLFNLNTRTEKHGEEDVPAADVKFRVLGPSTLLDYFSDRLRPFLFREPGVGEKQSGLDLGGDKRTMPAEPKLEAQRLSEEFPGYLVTIAAGIRAGKPVVLGGATLKGFSFLPKEGGAVEITFTVSAHPDGKQVATLYEWQRKNVVITLDRPKSDAEGEQQELGDTRH